MTTRTQVWASGGGVQSTAIAALIVQGKLRPDLAIIVDTHREKSTTWKYLEEVTGPALAAVGTVLHRVSRSDFESRDLYGGKDGETLLIPAFTDQSGEIGKLSNWCSSYWKREVIKRWTNAQGAVAVDQWLGISTDEMERVQQQRRAKWATRYPLIEFRMNRGDCIALIARMGWPPAPRSSCWMCPNQTQEEWRGVRVSADWPKAVTFDHEIRRRDPHAFVHSDAVPLESADLDDANGVLFGHGCDSGHCFT